MNMRKGLTLIELLIVVTIIAILAGAAIPYVQDYVEEARRSRCRNDIDEVVKALSLYELRRSTDYATEDIASLVGPFLQRAVIDPWGAPFAIAPATSTVRSFGPDGQDNTGDEIVQYFRPRMAATKITYNDVNDNGKVDVGSDTITIYFTRPILSASPGIGAAPTGFTCSWGGGAAELDAGRIAPFSKKVMIASFTNVFTPGAATITIVEGSCNILDCSNDTSVNKPKDDMLKVLAE